MGGFLAIQHFSAGGGKTIQGKNFSYDDETATVYLNSGWIEGVDYSGHDAILRCPTGDIVIPNGNGKILSVVDSNGIRSTYKIEFGSKTIDDYTYNHDKTEVILGKSYGANGQRHYSLTLAKAPEKCLSINASMMTRFVELYGTDGRDTIIAGNGGCMLSGTNDWNEDTLYGGLGEDVFYWDGQHCGNDTIYNYTKGQDVIEIGLSEIDGYTVVGNDVILRSQAGELTIKNISPDDITLRKSWVKKEGQTWINEIKKYDDIKYENDKVIIGRNLSRSFYLSDLENPPKDIDASNREWGIHIEGDERDNIITTDKSGMFIDGMGGNDTIYLSKKKDVVYFGSKSGNDIVYNYGAGDVIKVRDPEEDVTGYRVNGQDIVLICGEATMTIKNSSPGKVVVQKRHGVPDETWRNKRIN